MHPLGRDNKPRTYQPCWEIRSEDLTIKDGWVCWPETLSSLASENRDRVLGLKTQCCAVPCSVVQLGQLISVTCMVLKRGRDVMWQGLLIATEPQRKLNSVNWTCGELFWLCCLGSLYGWESRTRTRENWSQIVWSIGIICLQAYHFYFLLSIWACDNQNQ